jgi:dienelactone hydrolase
MAMLMCIGGALTTSASAYVTAAKPNAPTTTTTTTATATATTSVSQGSQKSAGATPPTYAATLPTIPPTDSTIFAQRGPYNVGVLTIDVPEGKGTPATKVEVWYPAMAQDGSNKSTATTYDLKEWLPEKLRKSLGTKPGAVFSTEASRNAVVLKGAPYPVVLFSHGLGGFRVQSAFLTTHLASWGFVVAAPDHKSRDLAAILDNRIALTGTADVDDLRQTVRALGKSKLRKQIDLTNLSAIGHSAGANAVVRWSANEPRVQGIVAMAGGVSSSFATLPDPLRPILFLSAHNDAIVRAQTIQAGYKKSQSPKRLIELNDSGHLVFSDICTIASDQGGILGAAEKLGLPVPPLLKILGTDGCNPPNEPVTKAFPIIKSSVVAELRAIYGAGTPGFALDQPTLNVLATRGAVKSTFTID